MKIFYFFQSFIGLLFQLKKSDLFLNILLLLFGRFIKYTNLESFTLWIAWTCGNSFILSHFSDDFRVIDILLAFWYFWQGDFTCISLMSLGCFWVWPTGWGIFSLFSKYILYEFAIFHSSFKGKFRVDLFHFFVIFLLHVFFFYQRSPVIFHILCSRFINWIGSLLFLAIFFIILFFWKILPLMFFYVMKI